MHTDFRSFTSIVLSTADRWETQSGRTPEREAITHYWLRFRGCRPFQLLCQRGAGRGRWVPEALRHIRTRRFLECAPSLTLSSR